MTFKPESTLGSFWLHDGTLEEAIAWGERIGEAPEVGYVYLLGYASDYTQVGATPYFPQQLNDHRKDACCWRADLVHCMVTRPAFNYREIEQEVKRQFNHIQHFDEVFIASITEVAHFAQLLPLLRVAPDGYGRIQSGVRLSFMRLMAEFGERLGLRSDNGTQRHVQSILDQHIALGQATGLSAREATINALVVIEARTGLNLSSFHDVLREAA